MPVEVMPYSEDWPVQFARVAEELSRALKDVPVLAIEHVGSTAVPGLAAKPILDIDIVVKRENAALAIAALGVAGYVHRGNLGVTDRDAMLAPDDTPMRHVYVCVEATLHLRNHLAVREVLRRRADLRERYGTVKIELSRDPTMDMPTYLAGKSQVLQEVLAHSDLSREELALILGLNEP